MRSNDIHVAERRADSRNFYNCLILIITSYLFNLYVSLCKIGSIIHHIKIIKSIKSTWFKQYHIKIAFRVQLLKHVEKITKYTGVTVDSGKSDK